MIFLIRHGESEANAGLPTCRPECGGLTERGRKQAQAIADFLRYYPPDLIVTSPYMRAKQTAEPTSFVFHNTPERVIAEAVQPVQEFTYLAPGRWEYSTTEDRRPEVKKYWQNADPDYDDGPGAESFKDFIDRVRTFLDLLKDVEKEHGNIAIFSHEQFINAVLWLKDHDPVEVSPQTMRDFRAYLDNNPIRNGAIVPLELSYHDDGWLDKLTTENLKLAMPEARSHPSENRVLAITH